MLGGINRAAIVLSVWILLLSVSAHALELQGSGQDLRFLQQIQGVWRSECRAVGSRVAQVYQQRRLVITFTDMTLQVHDYPSEACLSADREQTQMFRYIVGAPVVLPDGSSAWLLNVQPRSDNPIRLSPLNLIALRDGRLLLGRERSELSLEQLTHLDPDAAFFR